VSFHVPSFFFHFSFSVFLQLRRLVHDVHPCRSHRKALRISDKIWSFTGRTLDYLNCVFLFHCTRLALNTATTSIKWKSPIYNTPKIGVFRPDLLVTLASIVNLSTYTATLIYMSQTTKYSQSLLLCCLLNHSV
jgi:hypothetical protein